MRGVRVNVGDEMRICCPTSPADGKRVRILETSHGYDAISDEFDKDFVGVEVIDTGVIGGIHRRYLAEVQ